MPDREIDSSEIVAAQKESLASSANEAEQKTVAAALMQYLDCPCQYFAPIADDDNIMQAYHEAQRRGQKEGFVPMLVTIDETLWECLLMNSDDEREEEDNDAFNASVVAQYRQEMLQVSLPTGAEVTAKLLQIRQSEAEDDALDWNEEVLGEMAGGDPCHRFVGYWDYGTENTLPLILAEIPVQHPWEIFAWLPFGGWNECPDTQELMAVTKYWYEQHGAVPAVMTHDVLEFTLPTPVLEEKAMQLALEQYAWCPDVVDQGAEDCTVGMLADMLRQSTTWYFWWD